MWLVLLLAVGKICYNLALMLLYESKGALTPDALIYLTVGRGILNGLRPYVDLFESKPPGIFYLSSLSLLFGGTFFMRVLQAVNLLCLPFGLVLFTWKKRDWMCVLTAFLFGSLLALRAEEVAGGLQTEIFCMLPVFLYIYSVKSQWRWKIPIAGLCVFLITIFREPFILAIFAASLLNCTSWREFRDSFIYPCFIAGGIYLLFLVCTGLLMPYLQIYLPSMLSSRIQGDSLGPLPLRALWVHRLLTSITEYSDVPLLGVTIALLWFYWIIRPLPWKRAALVGAAALIGIVGVHEYFVLFTVIYRAGRMGMGTWDVLTSSNFIVITLLYLLCTIGYVCFLFYVRETRRIAIGLFVPVAMSLAISMGGYEPNYLLFMFPVLIVLFTPKKWVAIILCLAAFSYQYKETIPLQQPSQNIDQLMTACHVDRYSFLGLYPDFAFSKYSPIGPIFSPYFHDYLGFTNPLYQQTYKNILQSTILIRMTENKKEQPIPSSVLSQFRPDPPCAKGITLKGYRIFGKS